MMQMLSLIHIFCVAGAAASQDGTPASGTPFKIFSRGVAGFFEMFGIPVHLSLIHILRFPTEQKSMSVRQSVQAAKTAKTVRTAYE